MPDRGQGFAPDESRAHAAEFALAGLGKLPEERFRDHLIEHRIAEKFEALVVPCAATAVGERLFQETPVPKAVPQSPLQAREPIIHRETWPAFLASALRNMDSALPWKRKPRFVPDNTLQSTSPGTRWRPRSAPLAQTPLDRATSLAPRGVCTRDHAS